MAAKKKKEEVEEGPTFTGIISLGILSIVFGTLLGFIFLASLPVKRLSSDKELTAIMTERATRSPRPDDAYYFAAPASRGRVWLDRREAFLSGESSEVAVSFGDLNGWTSSYFRPLVPGPKDDKPFLELSVKEPMFGTDGEGTVYLSMPLRAEAMDVSKSYIVHARGRFDGSPDFNLDRIYVNNAPVPNLPGISSVVFNSFLGLFAASDEFIAVSEVWPQVKAVEVTEDSLRLNL